MTVRHTISRLLPDPIRRRARGIESRLRIALGFPAPIHSEDRRVLEHVIIPWFSGNGKTRHALFVGCESYTRHYSRLLKCEQFWTIEPDPEKKRWGGRPHIVDYLENLHLHAARDLFDLILCNGVFGWGLNERAACESAFGNCHASLKPGGFFVLGWNDVPEHRPILLESIESLKKLNPWIFPPLQSQRYFTGTLHRHVYDFYQKPLG